METTGFKARGSFGIPPEMQEDLQKAREQSGKRPPNRGVPPAHGLMTSPPKDVPSIPGVMSGVEAPVPADAVPTDAPKEEKEDSEAKYYELKQTLETRLEAQITPDDIKTYLFKGELVKEVAIIPGHLKGHFKLLTPTEYFKIDESIATIRDKGKFTADGLENHKAILTLSYAWISADGKPLSAKNEPETRQKNIVRLGSYVVDSAVAAFQDLGTLLKLVLNEKTIVKKS